MRTGPSGTGRGTSPGAAAASPEDRDGSTALISDSLAPDTLDAQVVFDDGSLQEWADATYGDGLVRISSALVPVS